MPFAFLIAGLLLVVSGARGTTDQLFGLIKGDFTGDKNFTYWCVAILILGVIGYSEELRPFSRAFMGLVIVVLFVSNGGFFQKFNEQVFGSGAISAAPSGGGLL